MACFIVSAATAVVVGVAEKCETHREKLEESNENRELMGTEEIKIPLSMKLHWLKNMLIGGVVLLLFEHIWHGEVTPWFPFLTAMADASDMAEMLREMATVGTGMLAAVTFVWIGVCVAAEIIVKRDEKKAVQTR